MLGSTVPVISVTRCLSRVLLLLSVIGIILSPRVLFASGKPIVALDIGHLPSAPGATSARGRGEYFFNKSTVEHLYRELKNRDTIGVVVLNSKGDAIALKDRGAEAARLGATLLISIHHDSVQPKYLSTWKYQGKELRYSDHFSGYSIFYSEKNQEPKRSLTAAEFIGDELRKAGFKPTPHHAEPIQGENRPFIDPFRGIYRYDDLIVLKSSPAPAVLIECGIIVNRDEEKKLGSEIYRKRLINAIARGIEGYLASEFEPQSREPTT